MIDKNNYKANEHGVFYPSDIDSLRKPFSVYCPGKTFCDLGSGDGRVLFLAKQCGARGCIGFELDTELHNFSADTINADFMDMDLRAYNILYYYLKGSNDEKALIEKINNEARGIFMLFHKDCDEKDINYFVKRVEMRMIDAYPDLSIFSR